MGVSLSWVAVSGKSSEIICVEMEFSRTGRFEPFPTVKVSVMGHFPKAGWALILEEGCEAPILNARRMCRLSRECEVVTCTVDERVMFSEATGWKNGNRVWVVTHQGEHGPAGNRVSGDLPKQYGEITDSLTAQQELAGGVCAEVDYLFNAPLDLVNSLVGFSYDSKPPDERGFEVLESTRKPWIQRMRDRMCGIRMVKRP